MFAGAGDLSAESIQAIWYAQNRKGVNLPRRLIRSGEPSDFLLLQLRSNYTASNRALKQLRSLTSARAPDAAIRLADAKRIFLADQRKSLVSKLTQRVAAVVGKPDYAIEFQFAFQKSRKRFSEFASPLHHHYLASKIVEENLRVAFRLDPGSRDGVVARLLSVLSDDMPKIVVRADVKSFFESIPHEPLLADLRANPRVSTAVARLVEKVLAATRMGTGRSAGVPRGLGISAALAETYMQPFDAAVLASPATLFYARYVDDMILVLKELPPTASSGLSWLQDLLAARKLELSENPSKRYEHSLSRTSALPPFEFLGYRISYQGMVVVEMSRKRVDRIRRRMKLAFEAHSRGAQSPRAGRVLVHRLLFLSSNARLTNSKSRAFVGIRFSNRHLSSTAQLGALDKYREHLARSIRNPGLASRVNGISFAQGFKETRFLRWKQAELKELMSVWKQVD